MFACFGKKKAADAVPVAAAAGDDGPHFECIPVDGVPKKFTFKSGLPSCCESNPDNYKVVAENELGRLVHMTLKPGESDAPHDHPAHPMYVVKGGKLKIVNFVNGKEQPAAEIEIPSGAAPFMPAGAHQVSNVGDSEVEIVFLELSGKKPEATPEGHVSPLKTNPECYKILGEDDQWFVGECSMECGKRDNPHSHREHFIYVVEGDEVTITNLKDGDETNVDGEPICAPIKPGAALPWPKGFHFVKNSGKGNTKLVFWEPKA